MLKILFPIDYFNLNNLDEFLHLPIANRQSQCSVVTSRTYLSRLRNLVVTDV